MAGHGRRNASFRVRAEVCVELMKGALLGTSLAGVAVFCVHVTVARAATRDRVDGASTTSVAAPVPTIRATAAPVTSTLVGTTTPHHASEPDDANEFRASPQDDPRPSSVRRAKQAPIGKLYGYKESPFGDGPVEPVGLGEFKPNPYR